MKLAKGYAKTLICVFIFCSLLFPSCQTAAVSGPRVSTVPTQTDVTTVFTASPAPTTHITAAYTPLVTAAEGFYIYPVQPGSPEWRAFKSSDEMVAACQVPEDILANMTTKALVKTVMYYPLWMNMLFFDNAQSGFESIGGRANCVQELLSREDAATELLAYYRDMPVIKRNWSEAQKSSYRWTLQIIETLMSQKPVQDKMTPEQHDEFIALCADKYREQ